MTMATRLQIATGRTLVVEVIVENLREAEMIYSRWSQLKNRRGLPWGGAVTTARETPRTWAVPVGADVHACCEMCMTEEGTRINAGPIRTCQNAVFEGIICESCGGKCPECLRVLEADPMNGDLATCPRQLYIDGARV